MLDLHRLAEDRSLAYHRLVVERLRSDPSVLERARERLRAWVEEGRAVHYARQWERVLSLPPEERDRAILDEGEAGAALRQATPFSGVLSPRERWQLWREIRERSQASSQ